MRSSRINELEVTRKLTNGELDPIEQKNLGQYFTPASIAHFMTSLISSNSLESIRFLDPGAGIGSLTASFLERVILELNVSPIVEVVTYEIDPTLQSKLKDTLNSYARHMEMKGITLSHLEFTEDFIETTVEVLKDKKFNPFTHAILNPPYKKIKSNSTHRLLLREVGVETGNLYSAFVALTILLMADQGEIVAIMPRSFCNGTYFSKFRQLLLDKTAIKQIHIFKARDKAFSDDDVLQENIILHHVRGAEQGNVKVSSSTDGTFSDLMENIFPFNRIVKPEDDNQLIHIPISVEPNPIESSSNVNNSLEQLDIEVSTGPVVDFRVKKFLHQNADVGTVPLIYPGHFSGKKIHWPNAELRKPNALVVSPKTKRMLFPKGYYVLVRRFSSKEERHRIVACVLDPNDFEVEHIGFENHLNVFHNKKRGLSKELAYGLMIYLNSTVVDEFFREFNGHTQVNATDLRWMKYPTKEILCELSQKFENLEQVTQKQIDSLVAGFI